LVPILAPTVEVVRCEIDADVLRRSEERRGRYAWYRLVEEIVAAFDRGQRVFELL
jgi:hypothetical protein